MNQLYVEANKSYRHGFVLTESELRRFNDLIREQIKKINQEPTLSFKYLLKFQNGVVAETDNIDTVLGQENEGSKKIISLQIIGNDELNNTVSVDFYNIESDNIETEYSIKYNIRSTDRDWVFVTSSQLEERISKIKRMDFSPKKGKSTSKLYYSLVLLVVTFVFVLTSLNTITKQKDYLPNIKQSFEQGSFKSDGELIIALEEARVKQIQDLDFFHIFYYPGIILGCFIILLVCYSVYMWKLFPLYNFCWGDYLDVFKKKETTRKTFNTVVIIGLLISIVGGIIANFLNIRI